MIFRCGAIVHVLYYDSILLKESVAFMGSIEDQRGITLQNALVRHSKDHLPPWRDSADLFWRCENTIFFSRFYNTNHTRYLIDILTSHFLVPARRGDHIHGILRGHHDRIGSRVGGWPHGSTLCLCG